jgi:hypothetical protein
LRHINGIERDAEDAVGRASQIIFVLMAIVDDEGQLATVHTIASADLRLDLTKSGVAKSMCRCGRR